MPTTPRHRRDGRRDQLDEDSRRHVLDSPAMSTSVKDMARTTLNFDNGLTSEQVAVRVSSNSNSVWFAALADLKEAVEAGKAKANTFYQVGEFANGSGARTAIRGIEKQVADGKVLPGEFDLRPVVNPAGEDGKKSSELWAALVVEDEDDKAIEAGDETPALPAGKARGAAKSAA